MFFALIISVLFFIGLLFMYDRMPDLPSESRKGFNRLSDHVSRSVGFSKHQKYSRFISNQPAIPVDQFIYTKYYKHH